MKAATRFTLRRAAIPAAIASVFCGAAPPVHASAAPDTALGIEVRLNTLTDQSQLAPAVAHDAAGNSVVVWESVMGLQSIRGQRFDALGHPVGDEFQVNQPTTALGKIGAKVAMDAVGNFVVVWEDFWQTPDKAVWARRFDATAHPLGHEFPLNSFTNSTVRFPDIAMTPDGDFVATWDYAKMNGESIIMARRFRANGRPKDANEFQVNENFNDNSRAPAIAMSADGDFAVAWTGGDYDVLHRDTRFRRFTRNGVARDAHDVIVTSEGQNLVRPAVAMAPDGDFAVAYLGINDTNNQFDLEIKRYHGNGVQQGGVITASTYGGPPALAMDAQHNMVIAYPEANPQNIYVRRYAGATPVAGPLQVDDHLDGGTNAAGASGAAVMVDADGDYSVFWAGSINGPSYGDIYQRRYSGPEDVDAGVSITDSVDPAFENQPVDYTVTVVNNHAASVTPTFGDATRVTADFNASVSTLTGMLGAGWACIGDASAAHCDYVVPLPPGGSAVVTFTATAPIGLPSTSPQVSIGADQFDSATLNNQDSETTTVMPDVSPDPFTFATKRGAAGNVVRSDVVNITGITSPVSVSVSGDPTARWSKNGGSFTANPGTIANGDTLQLRLTAPASGQVSMTVNVGDYSTTYTVKPRL
jgi:hypothetical protein